MNRKINSILPALGAGLLIAGCALCADFPLRSAPMIWVTAFAALMVLAPYDPKDAP